MTPFCMLQESNLSCLLTVYGDNMKNGVMKKVCFVYIPTCTMPCQDGSRSSLLASSAAGLFLLWPLGFGRLHLFFSLCLCSCSSTSLFSFLDHVFRVFPKLFLQLFIQGFSSHGSNLATLLDQPTTVSTTPLGFHGGVQEGLGALGGRLEDDVPEGIAKEV